MDYTLRQATGDDYQFCYNLTRRNMYDLFCRHWGGWVDAEFSKGYVVENTRIIVVGNTAVGYFSHKIKDKSLYIDNIQLLPSWQRKGLGTRVLKSFCNEHRHATIQLTTFEDNQARQLYERIGFVIVEKRGFTLKMERRP